MTPQVNVVGEFESSVEVRKEYEAYIKKLRADYEEDIKIREAQVI